MTKRGFVFSLDALFATIILAMFIFAFSFLSAGAEQGSQHLLLIEKQANDLLLVIDKTDKLSSLNASLVNNSINDILTPNLSWFLIVEYYNYSNGFNLEHNFSLGQDYSNADDMINVKREFLVFGNNTISYYGIARLKMWAE